MTSIINTEHKARKPHTYESYVMITRVYGNEKEGGMSINGYPEWNFFGLMDNYTFADGSVFGIREE